MKITKSRLSEIISQEIQALKESSDWFSDEYETLADRKFADSQDEFASAAGLEQDIEMRHQRGDFEKGDWGSHEQGLTDYGEYPWVQAALEDLRGEEAGNKEKALRALANELGISVTFNEALSKKDSEKAWADMNNAYLKKQGLGHFADDAPGVTSLSKAELRALNKPKKSKKRSKIKEAESDNHKKYPNNSTMRKLVGQAKMDGRYKEDDPEKLKKAYDKHVRGTLRDPKHSQAHKKE